MTSWTKKLSDFHQAGELPIEFQHLIALVEKQTGVPVRYVSNGVGRDQLIEISNG